MNEELERKISLYLDGELDEREAAEVERLLGSDAEARALAEGFRRVGEELRALDPSARVEASGGFFRSVLERARRAGGRFRNRRAAWRRGRCSSRAAWGCSSSRTARPSPPRTARCFWPGVRGCRTGSRC